MDEKVYTSISISETMKTKFEQCVVELGVDEAVVLSVLCSKAGRFICTNTKSLRTVEYQERGGNYEIMPVSFFVADHEYIHANRFACKVSVSKILAYAMELFLDEIMEKGIDKVEIGQLHIIKNSYKRKHYIVRNYVVKTRKNDHFEDYKMQIRMKKT